MSDNKECEHSWYTTAGNTQTCTKCGKFWTIDDFDFTGIIVEDEDEDEDISPTES